MNSSTFTNALISALDDIQLDSEQEDSGVVVTVESGNMSLTFNGGCLVSVKLEYGGAEKR